ncbi:MAG: choice-of-anchor Q domain-containing protein [Candidatus Electronema sp. VV]
MSYVYVSFICLCQFHLPHKIQQERIKMKEKKVCPLTAAAAAILLCGMTQAAQAAEITVDGTTCTLANAITAANTNADAGGCVRDDVNVPYGDDTITLTNSITLTAALPAITSPITINGAFSWYGIDGQNNDFSVLTVTAAGNLTLKNTYVTGANMLTGNGGGIHNSGIVRLINTQIYSNKASLGGGIYNIGDGGGNNEVGVVIVDESSNIHSNTAYDTGGGIYSIQGGNKAVTVKNSSSISSNTAGAGGGGIYSSGGAVTVDKSSIASNSAGNTGAGLYINGGTLTLTDSTVEYNAESGNMGGGLAAAASVVTVSRSTFYANSAKNGAGLAVINGATATLNNSTISYNTATAMGGGIFTASSATFVTLNNTTVSQNTADPSWGGGGIMVSNIAQATLNHSIVSGNSAGEICNEVYNNGGTVNANNYNVFGDNSDTDAEAYCGFAPTVPTDVNATTGDGSATGTALSAILDTTTGLTFTDSRTAYYALPAGSPAIDLGGATCPNNAYADQRGFNRPINFKCDAGSYEYSAAYSVRCGNGHDLPASTYVMTAPSCVPVPAALTSQYSELGTLDTNWAAWKWSAGAYVKNISTDTLTFGGGNWLYSLNAGSPLALTATMDTPTVSCSTYNASLTGNCYAINLTPSTGSDIWQIVGQTFPYIVDWADVRVAASTDGGATWTTYTPSEAEAANLMLKTWWRYTGSAYDSYDDSTPGMIGTLRPQESFWVRIKSGSSSLSNFKLLIPAR